MPSRVFTSHAGIEDRWFDGWAFISSPKGRRYAKAVSNLVKHKTKLTVHNWIVERRMAEARSLLLKTDEPVNHIAAKVGYPDAGHFIRQFRHIYFMSPKVWRNTHRTQLEHRLSN